MEEKNIEGIKKKVNQLVMMKRSKASINHLVANWLMQEFEFRCVVGTASKDPMYVYEDGVFAEKGEIFVANYCEQILEVGANNNSVNQIIQKIKRQKNFKRKDLGCKNLDLICLNNCVLNLRTKKTYEHSSKYGFMSKIPVDYNPHYKSVKFENWLSEILIAEDLLTCQEWFGFMLYRRYHEKSALVLIGPKHTGKTVLLTIMEKFVGSKNTSAVDFHDIINNRFSSNNLYNKLININDELDASDLKSTVMFKRLLGKSLIPAEAKNQTPYQFVNYAKLVFATNKMPLPTIVEDPSSYFDKFITFELDNVFEKDDPNTNKMLDAELTTPEELSGILNWAIIGFQRLIKNNKFSKSQHWEDVETVMKRSGESVYSFEIDGIEKYDGVTQNGELYDEYCKYCEINDKTPESPVWFGRKFNPRYGKRINSGKQNGWKGIKPKYMYIRL